MRTMCAAVMSVGLLLGLLPGPVRADETVILACRVGSFPGSISIPSIAACGTSAGVLVACPVSPVPPPPPGAPGVPCAPTLATFLTQPGFKLVDVHATTDQIVYTIVNKHAD
jgi:hypothetical protein